jgi:hypothetical protein
MEYGLKIDNRNVKCAYKFAHPNFQYVLGFS